MDDDALLKIGEVAERTLLSLRTIRHYEEVGVVVPSARSKGGFRLYTQADVDRLLLVRRMKPLDFTLEQVRDLLSLLDALQVAYVGAGPGLDDHPREAIIDRVRVYLEAAVERERALLEEAELVRGLAQDLRSRVCCDVVGVGPESAAVPEGRRG